MYAGEIVEEGKSMDVIQRPSHPYTEGLLKCLPALHAHEAKDFRLPTITGMVPHLGQRPSGCQLNPRCSYKVAECEKAPIKLTQLSADREVRCIKPLTQNSSQSVLTK
jgi:oligopeptide/dipeptide ABC transporter ATP-binding protein